VRRRPLRLIPEYHAHVVVGSCIQEIPSPGAEMASCRLSFRAERRIFRFDSVECKSFIVSICDSASRGARFLVLLGMTTCGAELALIRVYKGHKFISHSVNGAEMHGIHGVLLELLPEPENMVVHGARGGVALVTPDLIE